MFFLDRIFGKHNFTNDRSVLAMKYLNVDLHSRNGSYKIMFLSRPSFSLSIINIFTIEYYGIAKILLTRVLVLMNIQNELQLILVKAISEQFSYNNCHKPYSIGSDAPSAAYGDNTDCKQGVGTVQTPEFRRPWCSICSLYYVLS